MGSVTSPPEIIFPQVVIHELAHQWFGNLVTMEWWDDLWLNEGFATWMETGVCARLHPEWSSPNACMAPNVSICPTSLHTPIHPPFATWMETGGLCPPPPGMVIANAACMSPNVSILRPSTRTRGGATGCVQLLKSPFTPRLAPRRSMWEHRKEPRARNILWPEIASGKEIDSHLAGRCGSSSSRTCRGRPSSWTRCDRLTPSRRARARTHSRRSGGEEREYRGHPRTTATPSPHHSRHPSTSQRPVRAVCVFGLPSSTELSQRRLLFL